MPWRMRLRSADDSVMAASTRHHVERRAADARKVGVRAGQRCHLRIEKDVCKPVLQHAAVSERLLEVWLQCADVQQGLIDVTDDDARHAAVSLSLGEAASGSDRVRAACEGGMDERAPAGHGFARSRSNCRRLTVHVNGTVWGVKHTLSSHAW